MNTGVVRDLIVSDEWTKKLIMDNLLLPTIVALAILVLAGFQRHVARGVKTTITSSNVSGTDNERKESGFPEHPQVSSIPTKCSILSSTKLTGDLLVPFVALKSPDWKILDKLLQTYRTDYHMELEKMSQSLEMALLLEQDSQWQYQPSLKIRDRINRLSVLFEEQEHLLKEHILKPFPVTMALPSRSAQESNQSSHDTNQSNKLQFTNTSSVIRCKTGVAHTNASSLLSNASVPVEEHQGSTYQPSQTAPASYDSVMQIMAHMVRDWTSLGSPVRKSLYHWCRTALHKHYRDRKGLNRRSVLVPGAGMGRLAWELAVEDQYKVEALEVSLGMAAAASSILHNQYNHSNSFAVYPYIHDGLQNQVHSEDRYLKAIVPDVQNLTLVTHSGLSSGSSGGTGSLSFTIGAFEDLLTISEMQHSFDAVITCFFVDTATNIFHYLKVMEHVLANDGESLWINVGPLQWHGNALLPGLAANELREILMEQYDIIHWSIDETPMEYRNPTSSTTGQRSSTSFSGYCPLRFVARKKK